MLSENICVLFVLLFSLTVVFSCSALTLRCDVVLCVNTPRKGGFTSVFRNGVKVQSRHSRQVFEPLCDTNTRGRARAVGGGEGTDGRCVFPGVFVGRARVECQRCLTESSVVSALKSVRVCSAPSPALLRLLRLLMLSCRYQPACVCQ